VTDDRKCTLDALAAARETLHPVIGRLAKRMRKVRRSCARETWVNVDHSLDGPPGELRVSPLNEPVLYRFDEAPVIDGRWRLGGQRLVT
jgi:hypothetical protein